MPLSQADEYTQLRARYAKLSDGALLKLADQKSELTAIAQQVLDETLRSRMLDIPRSEVFTIPDTDKFVVVNQYTDLGSALFARSALDSLGYDCRIQHEEDRNLAWFIENAPSGIYLEARAKFAAAAQSTLQDIASGDYPAADLDDTP